MIDWKKSTISECCEILDSRRIPLNSEQRDKIPGDIPYYGANGVQGYINKFIFDDDLILIAEDGGYFDEFATRPIAYRISGKSWINNHAHILKAKKGYNQDYIFFSLEHRNILFFIKGGTRAKLNQAELRALTIDHPIAEKEQDTVATLLNKTEKAIQQTENLIEKNKLIKAGLMQDLFGNLLSGKCQIVSIKNVCKLRRGASPRPIDNPCYFSDSGRGWIRISDVTASYKYLQKTVQYLSRLGESLSVKVNPGDLIMSICATIGRPIIVQMQACIHDGFVFFDKLSDEIDSEYLFYYLLSKEAEINRNKQIGTQGNLNTSIVNAIIVPKPIKEEQTRIASVLRAIDNSIQSEENQLVKLLRLKAGLMQDLLTGKVRVTPLMREAVVKHG